MLKGASVLSIKSPIMLMTRHRLMKCFRSKTKSARLREITKIRISSVCTCSKHLRISQVIRIQVVNLYHQKAYSFQKKVVEVTAPHRSPYLLNSIINKNRSSSKKRRNFKITEISLSLKFWKMAPNQSTIISNSTSQVPINSRLMR